MWKGYRLREVELAHAKVRWDGFSKASFKSDREFFQIVKKNGRSVPTINELCPARHHLNGREVEIDIVAMSVEPLIQISRLYVVNVSIMKISLIEFAKELIPRYPVREVCI